MINAFNNYEYREHEKSFSRVVTTYPVSVNACSNVGSSAILPTGEVNGYVAIRLIPQPLPFFLLDKNI